MGGCGGKKRREKAKAGTLDNNFNSIGTAQDQMQNLELVTRLMGEIGMDGERMVDSNSKLFLQDCRIKLNQKGTGAMFGWRQVEKMVALHKQVTEQRNAEISKRRLPSKANTPVGGGSPVGSPLQAR